MKSLLRWLRPVHLRLGIIVVPWLAAAVYLIGLAADRYVSESVVVVRQEGAAMSVPGGLDALSAMIGGSSLASNEDQYMLQAHILSMDMLRRIDEKLDLRRAYSRPKLDFIFRLDEDATQETFLDYYRSRIEVEVDDASGLLTIRTQGFTPEIAQAVNQEVVTLSERFINESSHELARDQMAFAESELANVRAKLDEARNRILAFQEKHGILDPTAQAAANTGLTAQLQAMQARYEAELKGLQAYLDEDAP